MITAKSAWMRYFGDFDGPGGLWVESEEVSDVSFHSDEMTVAFLGLHCGHRCIQGISVSQLETSLAESHTVRRCRGIHVMP